MKSHHAKDRAANRGSSFYNGLLSGTDDEFNMLLRQYAIYSGVTVNGHRGVAIDPTDNYVKVGKNDPSSTVKLGSTNSIALQKVQKGYKVAWLNLSLSGRQQQAAQGLFAAGDRMEMQKTYAPTQGWVASYFLPWGDLMAVRLTIPPMGDRTTKGLPDPNIFFTAAISGCSIIFQGTPQNPTIYHCGGTTNTEFEESREFWRSVVAEFSEKELAQTGKNRGGLVDSVDKTDYVTERGAMSTAKIGTIDYRQKTTFRAKNYLSLLRAKHALGKLVIQDVAPWGCVLGRRAANGDWTFYLQENADITYHSVSRSLSGGMKKVASSTAMVSRPMTYREVFPQGPRTVCLRSGLPKIL